MEKLPNDISTNGLRILHVHNNGTIDEINNVIVTNGVAAVEVESFSEFVLITLVIDASHGFCMGWIAFIICGGFVLFFLEDRGITKLFPKKVEDKPHE